MAGASLPHIFAAGLSIHLGGDGLQNLPAADPAFVVPSDHHAGAVQRPQLPAGDPHPQVLDPLFRQSGAPSGGVLKMGIAPVDDHILRLQIGEELSDDRIYRFAGGHH